MNLEDKRRDYLNKMYQIIGAAMEVYNELGFGLSEPIYQECLSIACKEKEIPWEREKPLTMYFRGQELKKKYFADFVCYGDLIVELKAVSEINSDHRGGSCLTICALRKPMPDSLSTSETPNVSYRSVTSTTTSLIIMNMLGAKKISCPIYEDLRSQEKII